MSKVFANVNLIVSFEDGIIPQEKLSYINDLIGGVLNNRIELIGVQAVPTPLITVDVHDISIEIVEVVE
jgi:hypothetical protein